MLPTDDGIEKVSIEEFQVALAARQLMLLTSVNLWWKVPVETMSDGKGIQKLGSVFWGIPSGLGDLKANTESFLSISLRQLATRRRRPCNRLFRDGACI